MSLLLQRCFNHAGREAAARCPSCLRYYCRECVTEHQGRMMCATCVARLGVASSQQRSGNAGWVAGALGGLLFAWLIFYYLGMGMAHIPSTFHTGLQP
jgi:hypothetical protein